MQDNESDMHHLRRNFFVSKEVRKCLVGDVVRIKSRDFLHHCGGHDQKFKETSFLNAPQMVIRGWSLLSVIESSDDELPLTGEGDKSINIPGKGMR